MPFPDNQNHPQQTTTFGSLSLPFFLIFLHLPFPSHYHVGRILPVLGHAERCREASKQGQAFKAHCEFEFKLLSCCLFSNSTKVIGSIVGLIVLIAIGVTVGVVVSKNNSKEKPNTSTGSGSSNSSSSTGSGSNTTNSNDPSVFTKDDRLHRSFYGMAYTPEGSLPDYGCSNTLGMLILLLPICITPTSPFPAGVIKDIQVRFPP